MQGWGHTIECGDVEKALTDGSCDHVIEGTVKMGGQEHFYLEPQGTVIIPLENDEMVVISSTQVFWDLNYNSNHQVSLVK